MFHGIASGAVDTAGFRIVQVLEDIESLNRRALAGELEISAVSFHAFAHLGGRYALLPCGASMGDGYGPCVVARQPIDPRELHRRRIAVPGTLTSAYLALRLYLGTEFEHRVVPFDRILDAVCADEADAGLIIHEGQLTYARAGLHLVVDLGRWWAETTGGLPLPLGANVVRRDLGVETIRALSRILRASIAHALEHREAALDYAMVFGRGLDRERTDRFVGMYVNELTREMGSRGRWAIERFLAVGARAGLVPALASLEFAE
jgi:1,4-dihydroxy-6-naphthoate synthase